MPVAAQDRLVAAQPGESDLGHAFAMRWRAVCHMVRRAQGEVSGTGPSVLQIAPTGRGLDWLAGFLADPHPPMPAMSLTRQEIRDLGAYFHTLRN